MDRQGSFGDNGLATRRAREETPRPCIAMTWRAQRGIELLGQESVVRQGHGERNAASRHRDIERSPQTISFVARKKTRACSGRGVKDAAGTAKRLVLDASEQHARIRLARKEP